MRQSRTVSCRPWIRCSRPWAIMPASIADLGSHILKKNPEPWDPFTRVEDQWLIVLHAHAGSWMGSLRVQVKGER